MLHASVCKFHLLSFFVACSLNLVFSLPFIYSLFSFLIMSGLVAELIVYFWRPAVYGFGGENTSAVINKRLLFTS